MVNYVIIRERDGIQLNLDREGAEYIATLCEEEFERREDYGAADIGRRIRAAYKRFDAGTTSVNAGNDV